MDDDDEDEQVGARLGALCSDSALGPNQAKCRTSDAPMLRPLVTVAPAGDGNTPRVDSNDAASADGRQAVAHVEVAPSPH